MLSAGESSRLHQRLVRREHLAIAAGGVDGGAGAAGAVHRLRRVPARSRRRPRADGAVRGDRPRARQADHARRARQGEEPARGRVRVRAADGRRHRAGAGPRAVRRGRLEALRRGRDPLPGGDGRRRAAGGEEVPGRQQPHPRHAGPARAAGPARRRETRSDGREADASACCSLGAPRAARRAPRARAKPPASPGSVEVAVRERRARGQDQAEHGVLGRAQRSRSARPRRPSPPSWRCRPSSASR